MAMKPVRCLLAVALLGCLAAAQHYVSPPQQVSQPQKHYVSRSQYPPQKPQPPPVNPQKPQPPPQNPQKPQPSPQNPQKPQKTMPPPPPDTDHFRTCEVPENDKIVCGHPGMSASQCEALNCCFDGRMCYYGKAVILQCTKDGQFIVVVARDATLPNIDLDSVVLLGPGPNCGPVATTSAFAIYQFPVTACGTVISEEPGVIVYENSLTSLYEVQIGPQGAITRDSQFHVSLKCRYYGTTVEALIVDVGLVPPPHNVAALGPLRVELRLGSGVCTVKGCVEAEVAYNSYHTDGDYPLRKVLRDPVYVEVYLVGRTDPNIALTLGRCWATADPNPNSIPQWDLLINGCPYHDDHYQTTLVPVDASSGLEFPSHFRRFIFKMFTFVGMRVSDPSKKTPVDTEGMTALREKVYIHCETSVCQPTLGNNCEPRCFRKRREIGGSLTKTFRSETTVVSSGEIIIAEESAQ